MKYGLPFNVLNKARWDAAPRDPVTVGSFILNSLGLGAAAATPLLFGMTTVGAVVGYAAVSAVTSFALRALGPDVSGGLGGSGRLVNARSATADQQYVYGQTRKGGTIVYMESTGEQNKYLHTIVALAGHECEEIGSILLNDKVVTLDGSGYVTASPWNSKIRIIKHDGSQTTADSTLVSETSVGNTFIGKDIAYLYIRMEHDPDVFAAGIPQVTAVVKGKKVYDPRTTLTAYSNNAALCIRDYITGDHGFNDPTVNDTYFTVAANDCDDNIPLKDGATTQKRYTIDGIVHSGRPKGQIMADMMVACNGQLFRGAGDWRLKVGVYTSPVASFTLSDFRSGIQFSTRAGLADSFNIVRGKFVHDNSDWVENEYPPVESAAFLAEDAGIENELDLPMIFTTNSARAQRTAKQILYRAREQMTLSAEFSLAAANVEVGDIVDLTVDRYGWASKLFQVETWKLVTPADGPVRVAMTLRETSEAAFDWDAEEADLAVNDTNLPDAHHKPIVGLSVVGGEIRLANEQVTGVALVDVTTGDNRAQEIEFQYRSTGATSWLPAGSTGVVSDSNRFEVVGISDGAFDFRARAISALGVRGDWATVTNTWLTIFATPPSNVEDFAANVVGNTLHLTWTPVADLDLSHYRIRYATETIGASYSNARDLVTKVSRPANSVTVPAQSGTYFIKAFDKLGNPSPAPTSIAIDMDMAAVMGLNVIETLTQHTAFAGAKTDVVLLNDEGVNYITLDTDTLFDSITGNFDDQTGFFDGGGDQSVMAATGYYEFDNHVDLGQKYLSRVSTAMDIRYLEYADTFDAAAGLFDSREGDFDGDPTQFDTTTARTQISYTDDDPSGAPTWSDWADFVVGDVAARAIRFRVAMQTSSDSAAPSIRELSAAVDMPDRVEGDSDITYTGSTTVTFPHAFKTTPAIGVAAALADGDRYAITSKSRTGFTITTYTGASVSTNSMTFDYVAKGYGKELS